MKQTLKRFLPDVLAIALFVIIAAVYMSPAFSGKTISQHDSVAVIGAGQEVGQYMQQTGEQSRWTNALFSGMPTYQSAPSYPASRLLTKIERLYNLFLPAYVWYLYALLIGFYILLRTLKCSVPISALGAIAWAFSSYFFIIIAAGHIWKVMTLAFIPPTIAGMVLVYRRQYLLGFFVTAFFTALQILSNHLQMTYYFLFVMLAMFIAYLIDAIRQNAFRSFLISTAVLVAAGLMGVAVNFSNIYHTYQYSKETMRGGSELVDANHANQSKHGLDRDYITKWSYGIDETLTLLVPNSKGGATSRGNAMLTMADSKAASKVADKKYNSLYRQLPQYFGEQPMTCGPVYTGAFICLLFVLGLILVRGPLKWALAGVTLLSVLLSWGHNFQWLTNLFIDYIPMYSKFRTVSSILVIAEFTIPLLGVLGLVEYFKLVSLKDNRAFSALWKSFAITGGIVLLVALFPSLAGPVITRSETSAFNGLMESYREAGQQFPMADFMANLKASRHAMISQDAWRSLLFILAGFIVAMMAGKGKMKSNIAVVVLAAICLIDLWSVDKRYLSNEMFRNPASKTAIYQMTKADEQILQDKTPDFRVLNFTTDTFNENNTSYYHKSIGGYHAAKLRRYQELIEYHIAPEMSRFATTMDTGNLPVLNMLNTRYFILPQNGQPVPMLNQNAFGNAWFVNDIVYVDNANQEIDALDRIDVRHVAVVDKQFSNIAPAAGSLPSNDGATVTLDSYKPNELTYGVTSVNGGTVVFSEIYYPGWKVLIDGKESELFRADYVLRAVNVPAGNHKVVMEFRPTSLKITDAVSFVSLGLMFAALLTAIIWYLLRKKKE